MNIDSDYARSMAEQLAWFDVQPATQRAQRNESRYSAQLDAVNRLESTVRTFRNAMRDMRGVGSNASMVVNSVEFSHEGFATASAQANAAPGSYQFFVEQLASSHQIALEGLDDTSVSAQGVMEIAVGAASFGIDLTAADTDGDGSVSLAELAAAINDAGDNSGATATLVRANGEVTLVLGSDQSGAANALSVNLAGTAPGDTAFAAAAANPLELSAAQDAQVRLGGETGLLLSGASNTFENLIDGVSLTFSRVHAPGEQPLTMDIAQDSGATRDQAREFVDAVNAALSGFRSLTTSGDEERARGPLAGDASIRSLENMINRVLRTEIDGLRLTDFGIAAGRDGRLTIDNDRFEAAVSDNPEGLNALFLGGDKLLDQLERGVNPYINVTNGVLANRKETLNAQLRRVGQEQTRIDDQYDRYYNRYLKQYTSMMQMMAAMQQTQGMFG